MFFSAWPKVPTAVRPAAAQEEKLGDISPSKEEVEEERKDGLYCVESSSTTRQVL